MQLSWDGPLYVSRGHRYLFPSNIVLLSLKLVLDNRVDPDKMSHYVAFHLGLHCFSEYLFAGI